MNKWMNEWMNELMNEWEIKKLISKWFIFFSNINSYTSVYKWNEKYNWIICLIWIEIKESKRERKQ